MAVLAHVESKLSFFYLRREARQVSLNDDHQNMNGPVVMEGKRGQETWRLHEVLIIRLFGFPISFPKQVGIERCLVPVGVSF